MKRRIGIFFRKVLLPLLGILVMHWLYQTLPFGHGIFMDIRKDDLVMEAFFIGIPFGMHRMCTFWLPGAASTITGGLGILAMNFIIGGFIGIFVVPYLLIAGLIKTIRGYE